MIREADMAHGPDDDGPDDPEQEAHNAGFESFEEMEDYAEDLNED